ncbi:MAG: hydrolase [Gammaproteobacteria bacterium]
MLDMTSTMLLVTDDSVLVIVDMQTRLLKAMRSASAQIMLTNTEKLLSAAKLLKVPVLLTEQYPKGLGPTDETIAKLLNDTAPRFEKTAFSCCGSHEFNDALAATERRQVIICGLETHVCVLQTANDLQRQDYHVHVVEDAVCSRLDSHKSNALDRLRQRGITVTNHESVLFEWLRDARHPSFKTISALVR